MKKETHPTIFENAKMTCACGATYTIPSTKETVSVEICSSCHPFYTGQEKVLDSTGRVDRFKKRMSSVKAKKS